MKKLTRVAPKSIYRILDANINRATEGMRVCEEILRFIANDRKLTNRFRNMRHQVFKLLGQLAREKFISKRDSRKDICRGISHDEIRRGNYQDIFFANMQRVKESIRVLEEFYKLLDLNTVIKLKKIRYRAYEIEKKAALKLSALSDIR